jgi:hypothetical protein
MAITIKTLAPKPVTTTVTWDEESFAITFNRNAWTPRYEREFMTLSGTMTPDEIRAWFQDVFPRLVIAWELAATTDEAAAGQWLPVEYETIEQLPSDLMAAVFRAIIEAIRLNFRLPSENLSSGTATDSVPAVPDAPPTP